MTKDESDRMASSEASSPEDAFALLANETRAEILQVIANGGELSFSEVRSQIDGDLAPSQVHYHLQQLVGSLVQKTDDGYRLRPEGYRVNITLKSVTLSHPGENMSVDPDFECYYCQVPVEAIFERGFVNIQCPECEYRYLNDTVLVSFDPFENETAAFEHFNKFIHHKILAYARGICPLCGNIVRTELRLPDHFPLEKDERRKLAVHQRCRYCEATGEMTLGMALLADQELRSFCLDHDVDIFTTTYWDLEFAATDEHVTVRSTDPGEIALEVTFDGDTLELVVDGDVNVIERNYSSTDDDRASGDDVDLPENAACLQALRDHRWPDGVTCPHCDSGDTTKEGTTSKAAQSYRCHDCDSIFNDLTETIFAGRGLSVSEMCYIIREMDETKTTEIARQLGRSYKPVLGFVHDVQDAREEDAEFDSASICPTD